MGASPRIGGIPANRLFITEGSDYTSHTPLAFGTARQPNTVRPTFVTASCQINTGDAEEGRIAFQISPDNVTFTTRGQWQSMGDAGGLLGAIVAIHMGTPSSFIIPKGFYYKLVTTNVAGTPGYTLTQLHELTL